MNTKSSERGDRAVNDNARADTRNLDWSEAEVGRGAVRRGEKTEVRLDGAVEYELRLIPSARVIGTFTSTLDAWPAILQAADAGRSPRTLSLDAIGASGQRWHMAAGTFLIEFARINNGESPPYRRTMAQGRRRVAEG